jgi:hypothetical protein
VRIVLGDRLEGERYGPQGLVVKGWGVVDADDFPLLSTALRNKVSACHSCVQWFQDFDGVQIAYKNFVQTFRKQVVDKDLWEDCRVAILRDIERALQWGERGEFASLRSMGGVRDLLGRDRRLGDILKLRVIRDLRRIEYPEPVDGIVGEWLCDVSLEAYSGNAFAENARITDGA